MASYFTLESERTRFPGMAKPVDSQCRAFQLAIDVLGRPWCALILNVLQGGPLRFSEIRERAQGPGDKVLSGRLKDLEGRGLILRQVLPGPPVRVTYELTDGGRGFGDVALAIERWGKELASSPKASRPPNPKAPRG